MNAHSDWIKDYEQNEYSLNLNKLYGVDEMKLKDSGGGDYQQLPPDTHIARCVRLIDLGTTHNELYDIDRRQFFMGFETPNALVKYKDENEVEHEEPFLIGGFYTMSLHEKSKIRPLLESWRGKEFSQEELAGFEIKKVLSKPCLLSVISETKNNKTRSKIGGIMKLPAGTVCPEQVNKSIYFSLDDPFDQAKFDVVPEGFQKMIKESFEWRAIQGVPETNDIPGFDEPEF